MSIIANYIRIAPADLVQCQNDQDFFRNVITGAAPGVTRMDLDQVWNAVAWLVSASARERATITYEMFLMVEGEFDGVPRMPASVTADQLEIAFTGDEQLQPNVDLGYGSAKYITAPDLSAINDALQKITHGQLRDQFAPAEMQGVHPDGWQSALPSAVDELLIPAFDAYRDFIKAATQNGECLIVYFN